MADYPDHQERPPPFENIIGTLPANIAAYKSTAVQVDNSGGGDATVRATWSMNDAPGPTTWEEKTVPAGHSATLFFVNQGDVLESVTVTAGGPATIHAITESNQLPLPPSAIGTTGPPPAATFGDYGGATNHHTDTPGGMGIYFTFASVHRSGVTVPVGGTAMGIVTSGVYEILSIGFADGDGLLQVLLQVNLVGGDVGGMAFAQSTGTAGKQVTLALLDIRALGAGDAVQFQAYSDNAATFERFRFLVRQLA